MAEEYSQVANKVIRSGLIITLFSLLTSPLGYSIRVILSRALTIEEYGLFYALMSLFGLLAMFNDLGFGYSVAYFIPKYLKAQEYQKVWNLYAYDQIIELVTSIVVSVILFFSAKWIAINYFKMPESETLISIFALFFIANSGFSALQKFFTGIQDEKVYSSMDFVRLFISTLLIFILWLKGIDTIYLYAWSWVLGYAVVTALYMAIQYVFYSKYVKRLVWDKELFSQMFKYAIPTLMVTSIAAVSGYTDIFILTLIKGVREVGIYNIVFPLAAISSLLFSPIITMFLPLISHHHDKDMSIVSSIVNKLLFVIPILSAYICFFIFLFTDSVIGMLFSNQWIASSTVPLKVLSLFYTFSILSMFLATIISGLGKVQERFRVILSVFVIQIFLGSLLTYWLGLLGTVFANCFIYLVYCWLYLNIIKKEVFIKIQWFSYAKTAGFLIILALVLSQIEVIPVTLIQFVGVGMVYSVIFFSGMFLLHQKEFKSALKLVSLFSRKKI